MERHFDELLAALKRQLTRMGELADTMIGNAIHVLVDRNRAVIPSIREYESQVNHMQVEIDEMCLQMIALHQPAAADLRFILGVVKTNTDIERLADQAVNILQKAERLLDQPPLKPFVIIPQMAQLASQMVKDSLQAYVTRDPEKARSVLQRDDHLDAMKSRITEELTALMAQSAESIPRALDLALIARNLERIGDHATNIAENAIFITEGKDVRHHNA